MTYDQQIIDLVADRPLSHSEIADRLAPGDNRAWGRIGNALTKLYRSGLLSRERIGRYWHYRVGGSAVVKTHQEVISRLEAERDQARAILAQIAEATAEQGFLFMDEHGHDDWPAAVAWLKKHIGMSPKASAEAQYRETINNWRDYARAYQADNAALWDSLDDALVMSQIPQDLWIAEGWGETFERINALHDADHPGAALLAERSALLAACEPFARFYEVAKNTERGHGGRDTDIIYALNDATITLGDLRRAAEAFNASPD
jgi:hypothetical protein